MAAPMFSHGISKQSLYRLILWNLISLVVLALIVFLPLNRKGQFDVIYNVLPVTLGYCCVTGIAQIIFWICFTESRELKLWAILKGVGVFGFMCVLFHVIAVLYGAPFTESTAETFHFAMLLSSLSVLPACVCLGPHLHTWIRVFAQSSPETGPESVAYITSVSSIIGAWLGAFPIPLDWDRPWQNWPISCVLGTIIGYCNGLILSTVHLCYKYVQYNKMKLT